MAVPVTTSPSNSILVGRDRGIACRQAAMFITHLETIAAQLTLEIGALERAVAVPRPRRRQHVVDEAKHLRLELYEVRHHIEALQREYRLHPRWGTEACRD